MAFVTLFIILYIVCVSSNSNNEHENEQDKMTDPTACKHKNVQYEMNRQDLTIDSIFLKKQHLLSY